MTSSASAIQKYGIRDRVEPTEVAARTDELRVELLRTVTRHGYQLAPDNAGPFVQVLEPMAEDDGTITQEIRVSVLVFRP